MMGQVSPKLRRYTSGYIHWCPACEETHILPDKWTFNGDLNRPTFSPSFKVSGFQTEKKDGKWTGEWLRDKDGKPIPDICHYNLEAGVLKFHGDSTHGWGGRNVELPDLPEWLTDKKEAGISAGQ